MKQLLNQKGMSLIELTIAGAITVAVAFFAFNFKNFGEKETERLNEDIQNMITRYGGAMVLMKDLTSAEPSFNYINIQDDNNLPFFVLAPNELCRGKQCERKKTLSIPAGGTQSESVFLIVRKGLKDEMLKFNIDPISTFEGRNYSGINWQYKDKDLSISKSVRPYSPWSKGRVLMLTSELGFYDCKNKVSINDDSCVISCANSGTCNYVARRQMKFLGIVNDLESDLVDTSVPGKNDLFKKSYLICRPGADLNCTSYIGMSTGLVSSRMFFEKLPYLPGLNNRANLSPVEVVEYFLKKPTALSPDHETQLYRTRLINSGGRLVRESPRPIISGITSMVLKRANISNPLIEYKLKKARILKKVR